MLGCPREELLWKAAFDESWKLHSTAVLSWAALLLGSSAGAPGDISAWSAVRVTSPLSAEFTEAVTRWDREQQQQHHNPPQCLTTSRGPGSLAPENALSCGKNVGSSQLTLPLVTSQKSHMERD